MDCALKEIEGEMVGAAMVSQVWLVCRSGAGRGWKERSH